MHAMKEFKFEINMLLKDYISIMPTGNVMARMRFIHNILMGFTENMIELLDTHKSNRQLSAQDIIEAKGFMNDALETLVASA